MNRFLDLIWRFPALDWIRGWAAKRRKGGAIRVTRETTILTGLDFNVQVSRLLTNPLAFSCSSLLQMHPLSFEMFSIRCISSSAKSISASVMNAKLKMSPLKCWTEAEFEVNKSSHQPHLNWIGKSLNRLPPFVSTFNPSSLYISSSSSIKADKMDGLVASSRRRKLLKHLLMHRQTHRFRAERVWGSHAAKANEGVYGRKYLPSTVT